MKSSHFTAGLLLLILTACTPQAKNTATPATECAPTLDLASTAFQIEAIQLAPDGTLPVLAESPQVAYWIDGTDNIFIFFLSPTPENLALASTITTGGTATATWSDCNSFTFALSAPVQGAFEITYLPDQTTSTIEIFIQPGASGQGLVINGVQVDE